MFNCESVDPPEEGQNDADHELFTEKFPPHDPLKYNDEYYSRLLSSLQFEDANYSSTASRKVSEAIDIRSPFLYMKGKIQAARLMKTLARKNEAGNLRGTLFQHREEKNVKLEREMRRTQFLCDREKKEKVRAHQLQMNKTLLIPGERQLSDRERRIERQILAPYRHNEDLMKVLFRRFQEAKEEQKERFKEATNRRQVAAQSPAVIPLEERISAAKEKREVLIAQQLYELESSVLQKEERSNRVLESFSRSSHEIRQRQWAVIVSAVSKFSLIMRLVQSVRETKRKDIISWRASKTIQRAWRRYCRPVEQQSLVDRMKSAAGNKESQEVFQQRVEAVDLIYRCLKKNYVVGKVWSYLRKVRRLQRFAKSHLSVNEHRLQLLERFLEESLFPLSLQIALVLSNKGLDLPNSLTAFEINSMKYALQMMSNAVHHKRLSQTVGASFQQSSTHATLLPRLFSEFFSVDFHALLREKAKTLGEFQRCFLLDVSQSPPQTYFGAFSSVEDQFSRLWRNRPQLKRKLLVSFLIQKRGSFLKSLHFREPLQIVPPAVSASEAMSFIKGGEDPLFRHLASIDEQIQLWQERRDQPIFPFRRPKSLQSEAVEESSDWRCPVFLLLSSISAAEVLALFLELADLILQYEAALREKRGKGERFGLLSVHRRLSMALDNVDRSQSQSQSHASAAGTGAVSASLRLIQKTFLQENDQEMNEETASTGSRRSASSHNINSRNSKGLGLRPAPPENRSQRSTVSTRKIMHVQKISSVK